MEISRESSWTGLSNSNSILGQADLGRPAVVNAVEIEGVEVKKSARLSLGQVMIEIAGFAAVELHLVVAVLLEADRDRFVRIAPQVKDPDIEAVEQALQAVIGLVGKVEVGEPGAAAEVDVFLVLVIRSGTGGIDRAEAEQEIAGELALGLKGSGRGERQDDSKR
jgi:hypothetical protein